MRRIAAMALALTVGGLALAGSAPAAAGGGCHSSVFTDEAKTTVELAKNCFSPTVVRVQPGDTVTLTSNDPEPHTVTGVASSWGMTNDIGKEGEQIDHGESVAYQFDKPGVFPYFCYFHPSMVGAVVVGDGRAASTGTGAGDGVSAVSAVAPGGEADTSQEAASAPADAGDGVAVPLVIGIGALAAMGGFVAATVLRGRSTPS